MALEREELTTEESSKSMVEEEFAYTTKMIEINLSNFSAWHSRSKLASRLLNERRADPLARQKFLNDGKYLEKAKGRITNAYFRRAQIDSESTLHRFL